MEQFALPQHTAFPEDVDPLSIAKSFAHLFRNLDKTILHPGAAWYDLFALTGDVTSVKSGVAIATTWRHLLTVREVSDFQVLDEGVQIRTYGGQIPAIEVPCTFSTGCDPRLQGVAAFSLVFCPKDRRSSTSWQVWMIRTRLDKLLEQRGDVDKLDPLTAPAPVLTSPIGNDFSSLRYGCVVVGAGQAGLAVAGRLKALGISYLAIDRNSRIGDNWLNRYDSVKLHTPREFSHLPYGRTFSGEYPEWLGKADIARGHNEWVQRHSINLSLSTELLSGQWDDTLKRWSLRVRQGRDLQTLTCDHIVLAIGLGVRTPRIPTYAGSEVSGAMVMHSAEYRNSWSWAGQRAIIIGSANTAHDIAEDMIEAGLTSVTMVQRGATVVLPREHVYANMTSTNPQILDQRLLHQKVLNVHRNKSLSASNPNRYRDLDRSGFKRKEQSIGSSFRGRYIDVGASQKIASGQIKVKSGSCPVRHTETGLEFDDGTHLDADIIIFATGYHLDSRDMIETFFGPDVSGRATRLHQPNPEDFLDGAYKFTGHPALWLAGGNMGQARYFSRFLALQINAALLGTPFDRLTQSLHDCGT
ncbi:hypothetical protein BDV37DRAFT_282927 [Aspergillus pseudonomiae]|uniref:Flavin-containing monooxygenase n=1 Tax=Aspergillus pseudonomiae TaxID=1506151 RepID=A0A5N7DFE2_9EURO|nr:uncharacterized protein BDV37DRAFT_282927 [Aspergillus pseudonomiae]KAE8404378.1 hypothetical protein BDV37DRAFT_282927 [Aspergillus pseudonomiae]